MADNIYDFEKYSGDRSGENDGRRQTPPADPNPTSKKNLIIVLIMIVLAAVVVFLAMARLKGYTIKSETATENNTDVNYQLFADGYIKYSNNGVEYQENIGTSVWNYAISYSHPYLEKEGNFALVMDRGKNKMSLYGKEGKIRDFTVKAPISSADLSEKGHVLVVMDEADGKYIQIYNEEGKIIADMKASVDYSGYPMAAAISLDGNKAAVSYFMISGMERESRIGFYDLNPEVKAENVKQLGSVEIENAIVPLLKFMDNDSVAVIGDNGSYLYDVSGKEPKCIKEIHLEEEIKSVFFCEKGMIFITENQTIKNRDEKPEGNCGFYLISREGKEKKHKAFDLIYEAIAMHGSEIIALNGNQTTIISDEGRIRFSADIAGDTLKALIPADGNNNYFVVYKDRITKIQLSRFSHNTNDPDPAN